MIFVPGDMVIISSSLRRSRWGAPLMESPVSSGEAHAELTYNDVAIVISESPIYVQVLTSSGTIGWVNRESIEHLRSAD